MDARGCGLRTALLVWLLAWLPIVGHHETTVAAVTNWAVSHTVGLVPGPEHPDVLVVAAGHALPVVPTSAPYLQWCADSPGQGYCTVLLDGGRLALPLPPPLLVAATAILAASVPERAPTALARAPSPPPPRG
ncbi:MAG TPA: hypothetical protein VKZ60_15080 [Chloroflexota bacterium]|nr:hypothetical protein [Chloroflexota bacterium]